jgi:ribosomal protein S6--L-glutamate ligase
VPTLDRSVVGLLERRRRPGQRGSLVDELVPALERRGARVRFVYPDEGVHRVDRHPPWDVTLLKSSSAAALHIAAAASAFGIPALNDAEATRLAQDRLASAAVLASAGVPVPRSQLAWLGGGVTGADPAVDASRPMLVKAARGSQGSGLWAADRGGLDALAARLTPGPYLVMEQLPRDRDDLKVFVAGPWMRAIYRSFPARSLVEKRGQPTPIPPEVGVVARRVGSLLSLRCYGCDFIASPDGWSLVDVNAFPGYKGADGAADAIADELECQLRQTQ